STIATTRILWLRNAWSTCFARFQAIAAASSLPESGAKLARHRRSFIEPEENTRRTRNQLRGFSALRETQKNSCAVQLTRDTPPSKRDFSCLLTKPQNSWPILSRSAICCL